MDFLNLFKKTNVNIANTISAPCDGELIDITEVKDKTFSSKLMGDGFAVIPSNTTVCSPCKGKLTMLFHTKHAFCIKMDDGTEVLVHIGIDTVNLNGAGFNALKKINDKVKEGTPIIEFDPDKLKEFDKSIMVIITNTHGKEYEKNMEIKEIKKGDHVITLKL